MILHFTVSCYVRYHCVEVLTQKAAREQPARSCAHRAHAHTAAHVWCLPLLRRVVVIATHRIEFVERPHGPLRRPDVGGRLLGAPQLRRPNGHRLARGQRVHVLAQRTRIQLPARRERRVPADAAEHVVFALTVLKRNFTVRTWGQACLWSLLK